MAARFPKVITWLMARASSRARIIMILTVSWLVIYMGIPLFHDQGSANFPPLIPGERFMPFMPDTIWIYTSLYPVLLGVALVCPISALVATARVFFCVTYAAGLVFFLYPTRAAYGAMPVPEGLSGVLLKVVRALDTPLNLLPSLHVAYGLCVLDLLARWDSIRINEPTSIKPPMQMIIWLIAVIWFLSLSASTLLVHQHHLADIATAVLTFVAARYAASSQRVIEFAARCGLRS